jgi:hypothetical protein
MNNSDLTLLAIRYLVRFFFNTILGVSIFAWLLSCHYDFWVSFFIGLGIGTFSFLLGWNFWGLCLAGLLYMFGAVHVATGVLLLVGLSIACKIVTGGVKGAVVDAIRETKKDTSSTPAPAAPAPWQPPAPVPKKQEPVSVDLEIVREVPPDAIVPYVTPTQRRLVQRTRRPL